MIVAYDDDYTRGVISSTEQKSIASCINTIASTAYGTTPFAREMGLKHILPRNNSEMAKNAYAAELTEAIEGWEDRVSVKEVMFTENYEAKVVLEYGEQFD